MTKSEMTTTGVFSHLVRPFEMVRVREGTRDRKGRKERKEGRSLTWRMGKWIMAQLRRNGQRAVQCGSERRGSRREQERAGQGMVEASRYLLPLFLFLA